MIKCNQNKGGPGGTTSSRKPTLQAWVFHFWEVSWACPSFQQEMKKWFAIAKQGFLFAVVGTSGPRALRANLGGTTQLEQGWGEKFIPPQAVSQITYCWSRFENSKARNFNVLIPVHQFDIRHNTIIVLCNYFPERVLAVGNGLNPL